jgi:hypothetical protein
VLAVIAEFVRLRIILPIGVGVVTSKGLTEPLIIGTSQLTGQISTGVLAKDVELRLCMSSGAIETTIRKTLVPKVVLRLNESLSSALILQIISELAGTAISGNQVVPPFKVYSNTAELVEIIEIFQIASKPHLISGKRLVGKIGANGRYGPTAFPLE